MSEVTRERANEIAQGFVPSHPPADRDWTVCLVRDAIEEAVREERGWLMGKVCGCCGGGVEHISPNRSRRWWANLCTRAEYLFLNGKK